MSAEELIAKAEKAERIIGRDYPRAVALKTYLDDIVNETSPQKIEKLSREFDDYIKMGLGWSDDKVKELAPAIEVTYKVVMEKRKSIIEPITDTKNLDAAIDYFKEKTGISSFYKKTYDDLVDFKSLLKTPEKFGLYEETQFTTPKQELNTLLSQSARRYKKETGMSLEGSKADSILEAIKGDDLSLRHTKRW